MNQESIDAIKYHIYIQKYNEINEETKDFGRAQFIKKILDLHGDIMFQLKENEQLTNELKNYKDLNDCNEETIHCQELQIVDRENQITKLQHQIDEAFKLLVEYRHYYLPDAEQNKDNEAIVYKAFLILKGEEK